MTGHAYIGADIFDGTAIHEGCAILIEDGHFDKIIPKDAILPGFVVTQVDGGTIAPGLVDLQVNGGGGVMLNDQTTLDGIKTIADAHRRMGTCAIMPTLITDTPDRTRAAIDAVEIAIARGIPGILGIHLEGPHLSIARKGAHRADLIRPMTAEDEDFLCNAAMRIPNVMVTVAPENVGLDQITRLTNAGVIVSLGHTDCDGDTARAAFAARATCVTHLFNAMSQMQSRAPGLVGAALADRTIAAGLIADGIHVHPMTMEAALAANDRIFLVSDAMATTGTDLSSFQLNGRTILRKDGRLTLEDGTLAGADLHMAKAVTTLIDAVGVSHQRALRMATSLPASVLNDPLGFGAFTPGAPWHGVHFSRNGRCKPL
ncbi:N-acetylglucosamine-6-phosphate deacetylase [Yoonia sp. 2307UL14-13]|uniref:N-acetylglucosamine-6-phosphate deacetylase n=1 Tax=Yoonia sp. 2307UL14-13 TaxID=3126506 RepID=UPI0030B3165A